MNRICMTIFFMVTLVQTAFGSTILWNFLHGPNYGGWKEASWHGEPGTPWLYLSINIVETSAGLNLSMDSYIMESSENWYLAEYGDVVDASTALGRSSYFAATHDMPVGQGGVAFENATIYDIVIPNGEVAYLAFATLDPTTVDTCCYGWAAFRNEDGYLVTLASAMDLDGGPMYVGGGSAPSSSTPEPSSTMLFLLGASALGIRRRWL